MGNQNDLDTLADSISDVVLPAPEIQQQPVTPPLDETASDDRIERLRSREEVLLRIDRMLISNGARLVLFLPLIVIVCLLARCYCISFSDLAF